ncbi:hypothetical protein HMPREF9419_1621 [Prevotella nigrescens ATCC 33563]|nr:hypothetical protein HMPREF9419_1621 [Prevotella nigrescens ATCC 33563]
MDLLVLSRLILYVENDILLSKTTNGKRRQIDIKIEECTCL